MFYATIVGGIILLILTYFFYDIYLEGTKNKNLETKVEGEN